MSRPEHPQTSLEFTQEWMERAATNASALGKHDSAALWRDAIGHLTQQQLALKCLAEALTKIQSIARPVYGDTKTDEGLWKHISDVARTALEQAKPYLKQVKR